MILHSDEEFARVEELRSSIQGGWTKNVDSR